MPSQPRYHCLDVVVSENVWNHDHIVGRPVPGEFDAVAVKNPTSRRILFDVADDVLSADPMVRLAMENLEVPESTQQHGKRDGDRQVEPSKPTIVGVSPVASM